MGLREDLLALLNRDNEEPASNPEPVEEKIPQGYVKEEDVQKMIEAALQQKTEPQEPVVEEKPLTHESVQEMITKSLAATKAPPALTNTRADAAPEKGLDPEIKKVLTEMYGTDFFNETDPARIY